MDAIFVADLPQWARQGYEIALEEKLALQLLCEGEHLHVNQGVGFYNGQLILPTHQTGYHHGDRTVSMDKLPAWARDTLVKRLGDIANIHRDEDHLQIYRELVIFNGRIVDHWSHE